jgi:FixJ family two-component response regulator
MLGSEGSKLQVISERWQEIQVSIDREKNYRLQSIEEQTAALEDRISHGKAFSQQKLQVLAEKTSKARDTVQQLQERREEIEQSVSRRLGKTEETLAAELAVERAGREEYREGWMRKCDEKLLDVCNSMENLTAEKG